MEWLPADIGSWPALTLILLSALTSALTAGLGIGGGMLMLTAMVFLLPPAAVIPLHGIVQFGSNIGRATLLWRDIQWPLFWPFALGAGIGVMAGAQIVVWLPTSLALTLLAVFILYSVWGKWPSLGERTARWGLWLGGTLFSVLTMFVGATGPLVSALLRTQQLSKERLMATFSASMSAQHGLKFIAFTGLGFAFAPWAGLLLAMIASGFIGTWLGKHWLVGRSDYDFDRILRWLLTLLCLPMLWQAWH